MMQEKLHTITESISVFGIPKVSKLMSFEYSLFEKANISIPSDASDILLWPSSNKSIIVPQYRCRSSKRNNSCVKYVDSGKVVYWGILEKLISFKHDSHFYCIMSKLIPMEHQICTDDVTNAKIHEHLVVCQPPRYVLKSMSL